MKVGFKRAPDKSRVVPKAGVDHSGKKGGASNQAPGIPKKLAAAKAQLAAKRALEAGAVEKSAADLAVKVEKS